MVARGDLITSAGRLAAALGGCLALAACVSDRSAAPAAGAPLFRASVGEVSGGVAPGPHAVWYVPREPVRFVKIGVATWSGGRERRGTGWLARLFRRSAVADSEPVAVAAAGLGLPTPSQVQVTNVATGRMVTLRIEDKAPIDGAMVRLPAASAAALGADPRQPLLVRLRYVAPLMAYEGRAPWRYALRGRPRTLAPEPVRLAASQPPHPAAPQVAQAPAAPVVIAAANPLRPNSARELADALRGAPAAATLTDAGPFRVQAGAFASLSNAERAADLLEAAGVTTIEPLQRGARTLYRVVVAGSPTQREAERLRERVTQAGFPDAWILGPL
jgi:rare lipoprotein A